MHAQVIQLYIRPNVYTQGCRNGHHHQHVLLININPSIPDTSKACFSIPSLSLLLLGVNIEPCLLRKAQSNVPCLVCLFLSSSPISTLHSKQQHPSLHLNGPPRLKLEQSAEPAVHLRPPCRGHVNSRMRRFQYDCTGSAWEQNMNSFVCRKTLFAGQCENPQTSLLTSPACQSSLQPASNPSREESFEFSVGPHAEPHV